MVIFLASVTNGYNFVIVNTLEDFTYNENLIAPLELSWEMKECSVVGYDSPEDFMWQMTAETDMVQDDIFKIKFLEDPDNLLLADYEELYWSMEPWAEFYLNSVLLGNDSGIIFFDLLAPMIENFPVKFIYPQTVQIDGNETSTFDYLYEDLKQFEGSFSGAKYKLTNDDVAFSITSDLHRKFTLFYASVVIDKEATVIYNKEWGILSSYEIHYKAKYDDHTETADILLEITDENLRVEVAYEWIAGISVLFIAGVVILRRKKRI
ncbi:MAG: hypothetical protein HeimAB125_22160 [Candidatus Heimdallarchaeota archaeon AB_125]|nr:MAG: hypothetical protein HeimAB125_22160 [Candidatus Heimdallarchaeota archaeon AB_125]